MMIWWYISNLMRYSGIIFINYHCMIDKRVCNFRMHRPDICGSTCNQCQECILLITKETTRIISKEQIGCFVMIYLYLLYSGLVKINFILKITNCPRNYPCIKSSLTTTSLRNFSYHIPQLNYKNLRKWHTPGINPFPLPFQYSGKQNCTRNDG